MYNIAHAAGALVHLLEQPSSLGVYSGVLWPDLLRISC